MPSGSSAQQSERRDRAKGEVEIARPQKITFGEMRDMGVRGVLVYCADYHCSHSMAMNSDRWPDDVRLSDVEPRAALLR
jgi:hypothetical protein